MAWCHTQRLRALPTISTSSDAAAVAAAVAALQWHRRLLWCATNHRPTTDPLQQRGKWFCLPRRSNAASFLPSFVQRTLHSAGPVEGPRILKFKYIPSNFEALLAPSNFWTFHRPCSLRLRPTEVLGRCCVPISPRP